MRNAPRFVVARTASVVLACGVVACAQQDRAEPEVLWLSGSAASVASVKTVASGLNHPWSLAFLPDGDFLVTERQGRLRRVRRNGMVDVRVREMPPLHVGGQAGLFDVVLHPTYPEPPLVYLSLARADEFGRASTLSIVRGRLAENGLTEVEELFVAKAWSAAQSHYGGRLLFDRAGYLIATVGDRFEPPQRGESHSSQDLKSHSGKVLRLTKGGEAPADNPFVQREGALPEILSYGHRNPQGLALDTSGNLWEVEHGPSGGDEVNQILPGHNFGWPMVGLGLDYGERDDPRTIIHKAPTGPGFQPPVYHWTESFAPSSLMVCTCRRFPQWSGSLFVTGLVGERLVRLIVDEGRIVQEEIVLAGLGRIRDVKEGPDGLIYLAVDSERARVVRLEPFVRRR